MAKKKTSSDKAAGSKAAKKKTSVKKPVAAKAAKKKTSAKKPVAAKAAKKKTGAKQPVAAKAAKKKTGAGKGIGQTDQAPAAPSVTVQIGPRKPLLPIAPGARLNKRRQPAAPKAKQEDAGIRSLTRRELTNIRNQLLAKRKHLLSGIRRELENHLSRANTTPADEVDKASDAYDESVSFEIANTNEEELEKIREALDKIEEGTYGTCEGCGCNIPPSRMKILPYATHCKACRAKKEMARDQADSGISRKLGLL